MGKRNCWHVRPTKTQIRLRISAVWSESTLTAWRNFASLARQNAPIEDSDQTARMRRLIWIFAWRTCPNVGFMRLIDLWERRQLQVHIFNSYIPVSTLIIQLHKEAYRNFQFVWYIDDATVLLFYVNGFSQGCCTCCILAFKGNEYTLRGSNSVK